MENLRNNNKVLAGILLAFIIVITVATASSFLFNRKGSNENKITLGKLELTLTEGNAIALNDTYPMSDSEGTSLAGYTFTLRNTGITDANYSIYLDNVDIDTSDTRLDDKFVKYSLTKDNVVGDTNSLLTLWNNGSRVLDTGTIPKDTTISYNLKLWVTSDIDADIGGQVWKGKLRIEGEQVH